jgi:hypothetical protein
MNAVLIHRTYANNDRYIILHLYKGTTPGSGWSMDMVARGRVEAIGVDPLPQWMILQEENGSGLTGRAFLSATCFLPAPPTGYTDRSCNIELAVTDERRTVWHVVSDSVTGIEAQVPQLGVFTHEGEDMPVAKLIGVYQVAPMLSAADVGVLDTRTRGGGLDEDVDPAVLQEGFMNFDIGNHDGEPFQSAGAVVVSLPEGLPGTGEPLGILTGWPEPTGWFNATKLLTRDEIHAKIHEHIALGVYPIEDYDMPVQPIPTGVIQDEPEEEEGGNGTPI